MVGTEILTTLDSNFEIMTKVIIHCVFTMSPNANTKYLLFITLLKTRSNTMKHRTIN